MNILILFAHPAFNKSKTNRILVDGLDAMNDVTFHDLYQEYPEMDIDVRKEQALLEAHDVVMFQFPMFWYSTPAILKEWQDLVLEHGWAYGSEGNKLREKLFLCSITAGSPRKAYQEGEFHNHSLLHFLAPLQQTSVLCKMNPLPPFVVHSTHALDMDEILDYKNTLRKLLNALISNTIKPEDLKDYAYMNDYLSKLDKLHGR